jgi:hypothetical protein
MIENVATHEAAYILGVCFCLGRAEEFSSTLPHIKNPFLQLLPDNLLGTFTNFLASSFYNK